MSDINIKTQHYYEQLTQVCEEVERLEYCLEGLCAEQTSADTESDLISILAVSQGFSPPASELY